MKKNTILVCIALLFFTSCNEENGMNIFNLKDVEKIEDLSKHINFTSEYDTINPIINNQVQLTVILDSTKFTTEHDILLSTDHGYLSKIPNINNNNNGNELTIRTAGLKVEALLNIDPELNNNVTIGASLTSTDNNAYSVHKKLFLSHFKPDKIFLSLNNDSLKIGENGLITGELQSLYGRVSDNLVLNFQSILNDSATVELTQYSVLSYEGKVFTNIINTNNKPGSVKIICSYGSNIHSDTLNVKYYQ